MPIDLIHIFMHIEPVNITWDARKASANLAAHGVSFADAEVVLTDPLGLTLEDPDAEGEQRFLTVGADAFGGILAVIHTYRGEAEIRIISARRATRKERTSYAQGI